MHLLSSRSMWDILWIVFWQQRGNNTEEQARQSWKQTILSVNAWEAVQRCFKVSRWLLEVGFMEDGCMSNFSSKMVKAKLKIRLDTTLKKSSPQTTGQISEMLDILTVFHANIKPLLWLLSPLWVGLEVDSSTHLCLSDRVEGGRVETDDSLKRKWWACYRKGTSSE